ncbi:MAG TPA: TerC family protein [Nannocystaceae bacterium]|nr:TerC family protein [Nannocystaceae bacterium]
MDQILPLLSDPEVYISLLVLSVMEIVLGIDNIVFITILTGRLPKHQQLGARRLGLGVALITRLGLLTAISWVMRLQETLFTIVVPFTGKDLILIGGGLFLLYKATHEIFVNVEHPGEAEQEVVHEAEAVARKKAGRGMYLGIILQIMVLDVVFSLDSVITAVGMAKHVPVMIAAMIIAVGVMLVFAGPIGDFIQNHPSVRILALAFLVLIGVMLIVEGTGGHVSKGYIYSAMGFSLFVQMLNIRMDTKRRAAKQA